MSNRTPSNRRHLLSLRELFKQCGWKQNPPNPKERSRKKAISKRGYEIRFSVMPSELREVVRLLAASGFKCGKPHAKGNRMRVPLYGKEQVARFETLIKRRRK